ncbi:MAG TPA: glycoside hydrolase family 16 protein [Mucilaginibacter sp.]|nr:glycoside hydrolase family 16 protein [Mucilaginibacter sp.]
MKTNKTTFYRGLGLLLAAGILTGLSACTNKGSNMVLPKNSVAFVSKTRTLTYQLVWSDEFNGTSVNTSNWKFETGGGGWGNNELEYYQAANATVANGYLSITAKKQQVGSNQYTSARMKTQGLQQFTYGRVEARIKMPVVKGLWPAFWMLGTNITTVGWPKCGEIDIMEHINTDSLNHGTIHWYNNGNASYGGQVTTSPSQFHVYDVTWTPTAINWDIDGVQYFTANIANGINGTGCFQNPFFIILNLAVGGNWPGNTIDTSKLPASMVVDYVRVYQLR